VKLTVAPDEQEPLTLSPEIDAEINPPKFSLRDVDLFPIAVSASLQICVKLAPDAGGAAAAAAAADRVRWSSLEAGRWVTELVGSVAVGP